MRRRDHTDTFGFVVDRYLDWATGEANAGRLAGGTLANYLRELTFAAHVLGDMPTAQVRPRVIQELLDAVAHLPGKQSTLRTALSALQGWAAVRHDMMPFMTGTSIVGSDGGHAPWTDAQVAHAEARAPAWLARVVTLGASTGQRASDLVRMLWTDIEIIAGRPGINVRQRKTGHELWVPCTTELQRVLERWPRQPGPILRTVGGDLLSPNYLSQAWQKHRLRPGMEPCAELHIHGLRGTACQRLQRAGATTREIASMVGMSEPMVSRYLRKSVQRDNAMAAVIRLDGTRGRLPEIKGR